MTLSTAVRCVSNFLHVRSVGLTYRILAPVEAHAVLRTLTTTQASSTHHEGWCRGLRGRCSSCFAVAPLSSTIWQPSLVELRRVLRSVPCSRCGLPTLDYFRVLHSILRRGIERKMKEGVGTTRVHPEGTLSGRCKVPHAEQSVTGCLVRRE